jgi:drug/metabolite transporter (DMT)-like permease
VVLLALGWGANAPALRYSVRFVPALSAAGVRFALGAVVLAFFASRFAVSLKVPRSQWRSLVWVSLIFTAQIALLNLGSARSSSGRQALLINSYPLFVPILAHYFLASDPFSWRRFSGTLMAFGGVLIVLGEKLLAPGAAILGDLLISFSAFLLAAKEVYTKRLMYAAHPYPILFWQMVAGVPCFLGLSLVFERQEYSWSSPVVLSLLYQGLVVAGLCFIGWTALLRRFNPSRLSVCFFMTPVFGGALGSLLLDEPITPGLILGGLAILAGVAWANRPVARN